MTSSRQIAEAAAARGSSLYYAIRFAPRTLQPALHALHAYQHAITEIPRTVHEPAVASAKLNWWRDELARAYAGQAQHPVAKAMAENLLPQHAVKQESLLQLIEAVETDLSYGLYSDFRELSDYCHRTGGMITELSVNICASGEPVPARYAHDLGMAVQLFELLRNVRRDLDAGRLYIPESDMQQTGVSQADLLHRRTTEPIRQLFELQAGRIDDFFTQALEHLPAEDRYRQRSGIVLARLYQTLLSEMRAEGLPLLERSIHLTPTRKLWIAWRTTRRQRPHRKTKQ
jgi:phytoene synthase